MEALNEEEAFLVAFHRLGSAETISEEFTKVNYKSIWLNKFKWFLSDFILLLFVQNLTTTISTAVTSIIYKLNVIPMNYVAPISLLTSVVILVAVIAILFSKKFSSFVISIYSRTRNTLYIILALLTFMNCIGFTLIQPIYTRFFTAQLFGQSSIGSAYFMIIWIIALSFILFLLLKKNTLKSTTR